MPLVVPWQLVNRYVTVLIDKHSHYVKEILGMTNPGLMKHKSPNLNEQSLQFFAMVKYTSV